MTISLNGSPREVEESITVTRLLSELDLGQRRVAVAVNREVIARADHETRVLMPSDRVEIVHAVQGG